MKWIKIMCFSMLSILLFSCDITIKYDSQTVKNESINCTFQESIPSSYYE